MTYEEYANFETAMSSEKIIKSHGVYWKSSHKIFYRPLNPFQQIDQNQAKQFKPFLGMKQYAVSSDAANSFLNLVVFNDLENYSLNQLSRNVRRNIKKAEEENLYVKQIESPDELIQLGHPVYVSHVERTHYAYQKERINKIIFQVWAKRLFQYPKVKILGVFRDARLLSFEINSLLNDVLMLKSIVNSEEGLKFRAPDMQLHFDRMMAKKQRNIRMIFDGFISSAESKDRFKLYRGGCILCLPARLEGNPMIPLIMKNLTPSKFKFLMGLDNCRAEQKCKESPHMRIYSGDQ